MGAKRSMAALISLEASRLSHQVVENHHQHGVVIEEIDGLIRVFKDGYIERPSIVPNVDSTVPSESNLACKDIILDKFTGIWARFYVPKCQSAKLPLLLYFHGGGFCVASAAWSCYHAFLAKLATRVNCVIMSLNYRLAPENRLPTAYEDGITALMWVKQAARNAFMNDQKWWSQHCDFSQLFLAGDSAGANIAYNVAIRVGLLVSSEPNMLKPICLKGTILIQPFFGGEARTHSERHMAQPPNSALTLTASDVYWRLSLPVGASRDHPWCNPLAKSLTKLEDVSVPPTLVCVSELDILKDRNLEFCNAMSRAGKKVEQVMYKGVGHAFQILNNSQLSQPRTHEMISHIKAFMINQ